MLKLISTTLVKVNDATENQSIYNQAFSVFLAGYSVANDGGRAAHIWLGGSGAAVEGSCRRKLAMGLRRERNLLVTRRMGPRKC